MAVGDKLPVVMGREKAVPSGVATLGADGILAEAQRPNIAQVGGSNPNLLINWDFRNPVNRNGKTVYTTPGQTIDCWELTQGKLSILESGIKLDVHETYGNFGLRQNLGKSVITSIIGRDITISFLLLGSDNTYFLISVSGVLSASETLEIHVPDSAMTIAISPENGMFFVSNYGATFFVAAKIEYGLTQTIARKNAEGEWEIIDPPDYDLQYLLCSQYSPRTGEWVGSQHSNPNLLDNAYWYKKECIINQRGNLVYNTAGYTVDRWCLLTGGITIPENGGISINPDSVLLERLEKYQSYENKVVTVSALFDDNTLISVTGVFSSAGSAFGNETDPKHVLIFGVARGFGQSIPSFYLINRDLNTSSNVLAAKLELGPVQTLAHKEGDAWVLNDPPPNYQQELAKCQRYQKVYQVSDSIGVVNANLLFIFKPDMRISPVIEKNGAIITGGGLAEIGIDNLIVYGSSSNSCNIVCGVQGESPVDGPTYVKYDSPSPLILNANL